MFFLTCYVFIWSPPGMQKFLRQGLNLCHSSDNVRSFSFFAFSRAAPTAYGGSQARRLIGAAAVGLRQSHSNAGFKPSLQPTPQLTATPDP